MAGRLLQASWKCAAEVCARQGQQRRRIAILPNTLAFHLPLPLSPFFRFPFSTLSLSLSPVLTFASIISIYPSSFLFTITISPLLFLVKLSNLLYFSPIHLTFSSSFHLSLFPSSPFTFHLPPPSPRHSSLTNHLYPSASAFYLSAFQPLPLIFTLFLCPQSFHPTLHLYLSPSTFTSTLHLSCSPSPFHLFSFYLPPSPEHLSSAFLPFPQHSIHLSLSLLHLSPFSSTSGQTFHLAPSEKRAGTGKGACKNRTGVAQGLCGFNSPVCTLSQTDHGGKG